MLEFTDPAGNKVTAPTAGDNAKYIVDELKKGTFWDDLADAMISGFYEGLQFLTSKIAQLADIVIAALGGLFLSGQAEGKPAFYLLVATIIEDLLGVPITASQMIDAARKKGRVAAMDVVGQQLYTTLQSEFTKGGQLSEQQGLEAAQAFLGFVMSFAIRQGNISVLSNLKYLPFAEGFREYGELMARNLGLGRLTRLVLRPLLTTLIATPLQWNLNRQYRPTKLPEATLVRAYHRGDITQQQFEEEMARLGYPELLIKIVETENSFKLPDAAWWRLRRFGIITDGQAVDGVRSEGLTATEAQAKLKEQDYQRQDSRWGEWVNALESAYVAGFLTLERFQQLVATAPISEGEKDLEAKIAQAKRQAGYNWPTIAQRREMRDRGLIRPDEFEQSLEDEGYVEPWGRLLAQLPGAQMTTGQYQQAFFDGIVDVSEWRAHLKRKGYSEDEQTFLTLQLLEDFRKKGAKRRAKGLTLSELRRAFKAGFLTLDVLTQRLKDLGFGEEVIALFVEELTGVKQP